MPLTQDVLDELWDFGDPTASEGRLRDAAEQARSQTERDELHTQVARALGLQERFAEATALLDGIAPSTPEVAVRRELERGRLLTSAGDASGAVVLFRSAADDASAAGLTFLHIDALHMLAIADSDHADMWTASALAVLDGPHEPRLLRWRVSLHNNLGWWHFDRGEHASAVRSFEEARDAATRWGTAQQIAWADEAIAEARASAAGGGS